VVNNYITWQLKLLADGEHYSKMMQGLVAPSNSQGKKLEWSKATAKDINLIRCQNLRVGDFVWTFTLNSALKHYASMLEPNFILMDWICENNQESKVNKNSLTLAVRSGNIDTIRWVLAHDEYVPGEIMPCIIQYAITFEHLHIIEWLRSNPITKSPDFDTYLTDSDFLITLCGRYNCPEILKWIIDIRCLTYTQPLICQPSPLFNMTDAFRVSSIHYGRNPISLAVENNNKEMIKLIHYCIYPKQFDMLASTEIIQSAISGASIELFVWLMESGIT
jgi:hypothetical protein